MSRGVCALLRSFHVARCGTKAVLLHTLGNALHPRKDYCGVSPVPKCTILCIATLSGHGGFIIGFGQSSVGVFAFGIFALYGLQLPRDDDFTNLMKQFATDTFKYYVVGRVVAGVVWVSSVQTPTRRCTPCPQPVIKCVVFEHADKMAPVCKNRDDGSGTTTTSKRPLSVPSACPQQRAGETLASMLTCAQCG